MLAFIRRYRRISAAFLLSLSFLFVTQRAYALVPDGEFFHLAETVVKTAVAGGGAGLVVASGGGGAAVTTAAGAVFGITPIGWAAIGVAVLGAIILTSDSTGHEVQVTVGTQAIDVQPMDDLRGTKVTPTTVTNSTTYLDFTPVNSGNLGYMSGSQSDFGGAPSSSGQPGVIATRIYAWVAAHYSVPSSWAPTGLGLVAANWAPSTSNTYYTGKCPSYAAQCVTISYVVNAKTGAEATLVNNLPLWAVAAWTYGVSNSTTGLPYTGVAIMVPLANVQAGSAYYDCGADSSYDYIADSCVANTPPAEVVNDSKCNVSWGTNGCPVYNRKDPDCASLSVNMTCGSATVPPSIKITNPTTGESMSVARPVLQSQGVPGQVTVTQSTPDPTTNTTNIKTSVLSGDLSPATTGSGTTVAPAPPVTQGAQQQVAPGTGAAQAAPASQVSILNWPKSIEVSNFPTEMKCSNCAPAVDTTVPADAPSTAPSADAAVQDQAAKFMDPVKSKFAGLLNFQLPAHAAGTCPAMNFHWDAWALKFDLSNNSMCEFLEQNRSTIQSVINLVAVLGAILIVLGA